MFWQVQLCAGSALRVLQWNLEGHHRVTLFIIRYIRGEENCKKYKDDCTWGMSYSTSQKHFGIKWARVWMGQWWSVTPPNPVPRCPCHLAVWSNKAESKVKLVVFLFTCFSCPPWQIVCVSLLFDGCTYVLVFEVQNRVSFVGSRLSDIVEELVSTEFLTIEGCATYMRQVFVVKV